MAVFSDKASGAEHHQRGACQKTLAHTHVRIADRAIRETLENRPECVSTTLAVTQDADSFAEEIAAEAASMDEEIEGKELIDTPADVSRRAFIKGVIGSGAAAFSAGYLFRASPLVPGLLAQAGVSDRLITLNVNGQQRRVDVSRQETLAWTLRYKLGLTGTKLGCDRAECGACTVLIDDIPRYSCSVLTHTVRGGRVLTIEGLVSADGTLHPVQRAVVDEQGFQCAFCMSGFIMSAVGFLKQHQNPTRAELARGLSGNLCRCCDYNKILNSMMRAAEYTRNGSNA
jgi:aerobic-type carbon monoxide dehydrogenase small subunit (CoxS/CutS family)